MSTCGTSGWSDRLVAMASIITLTTDFGGRDPYVAAMKGVILRINPAATLVDVSHEIRGQDVEEAVYLTGQAWPWFPDGCVHIAVVDPGVGTARRSIIVETARGLHVGPDNGVLSACLPDPARRPGLPLPEGVRAFAIERHEFRLPVVSPTFHGRDVFAPAAAHLSRGVAPDQFGPPLEKIEVVPPLRASRQADGRLDGRVIHVDRFGNAVTDVRGEDLPAAGVIVEAAGRQLPLVRTYAEARGPAALVGSGGYLEIAVPGSSAERELGLAPHSRVSVRPLTARER